MSDDFRWLQSYPLFVYIKRSVHFTWFGDILFTFYEVGVVDRDRDFQISKLRFSSFVELCL